MAERSEHIYKNLVPTIVYGSLSITDREYTMDDTGPTMVELLVEQWQIGMRLMEEKWVKYPQFFGHKNSAGVRR